MKKQLFKTLLLSTSILTLLGVLGISSNVTYADEVTSKQEVNTTVTTEIDSADPYTESVITDENGTYLGTLVVESVPAIQGRSYINQALSNKTFDVKFIGVTCNFGYKVTVKNKKIVNAYGTWSNGIIWSTSLGRPYHTSTTSGVKGRTKFGYKDFSFNSTVRLTGNIKGNRLITNIGFK